MDCSASESPKEMCARFLKEGNRILEEETTLVQQRIKACEDMMLSKAFEHQIQSFVTSTELIAQRSIYLADPALNSYLPLPTKQELQEFEEKHVLRMDHIKELQDRFERFNEDRFKRVYQEVVDLQKSCQEEVQEIQAKAHGDIDELQSAFQERIAEFEQEYQDRMETMREEAAYDEYLTGCLSR